MQLRTWLKRFDKWFGIIFACWCVVVWTVGSWQAGHLLGPDDLIPTANRWMGWK